MDTCKSALKVRKLAAAAIMAGLMTLWAVPAGADPGVDATPAPTPTPSADSGAAPLPSPEPSPSVALSEEPVAPEPSDAATEPAVEEEFADPSMSARSATSEPSDPVTFTDAGRLAKFEAAITWMGASGIANGSPAAGGREYRPYGVVTREAMAAFLYRYAPEAKKQDFELPETPTFPDVTPGSTDF